MYREKIVSSKVMTHPLAVEFVQEANRFTSDIYVDKEQKSANAKSVLGVIALMIQPGDVVTLSAQGPDAGPALSRLCSLIGETTQFRNEYSSSR